MFPLTLLFCFLLAGSTSAAPWSLPGSVAPISLPGNMTQLELRKRDLLEVCSRPAETETDGHQPRGLVARAARAVYNFARGFTEEYKAVNKVVREAGESLKYGHYYYFRLCNPLDGDPPQNHLQKMTGCYHHYFMLGKVTKAWHQKDFQGKFWHVKYRFRGGKWEWHRKDWSYSSEQWMFYKGEASESAAGTSRIDQLALAWVAKKPFDRDLGDSNCLGFTNYLISRM